MSSVFLFVDSLMRQRTDTTIIETTKKIMGVVKGFAGDGDRLAEDQRMVDHFIRVRLSGEDNSDQTFSNIKHWIDTNYETEADMRIAWCRSLWHMIYIIGVTRFGHPMTKRDA